MEVILLEKVAKLGNVGDIVLVKSGYARNYLIPNQKCLRATESNKKIFEEKKAHIEAENLTKRNEAETILTKIANFEVVMVKKAGESGHLYGSVKPQDIAICLNENNFNIDKKQIEILSPIKTLGISKILVKLHPEISTHILLNVARSNDEAISQMKEYLQADSKKSTKETSISIQQNNKLEVSTAEQLSNSEDSSSDELENFEEFKEEVV
ncbi:50S ribosomal protein L9 [Candidatus Hepatincola sp. Pdp]